MIPEIIHLLSHLSWLFSFFLVAMIVAAQESPGLRSYLTNGTALAVAYDHVLPPSMFIDVLKNIETFGERLEEREKKGMGDTAYISLPTESCAFPHNVVTYLLATVPELKGEMQQVP